MKLIQKIRTVNIWFLLKVSIGSAVAILLADFLGLLYSPSAGIITLLTIQQTKRETIFVSLKRFIAFMIAVLLVFLFFEGFGYTPIAFGGFIFLFVALCLVLGLKDGIAMNAVLMTHFLIEKRIDFDLFFNEIGILVIGMSIGVLLNLIMPNHKKKIREAQIIFEEEIKYTLRGLSGILQDKEACLLQEGIVLNPSANNKQEVFESDFNKLDHMLEGLLKKAYEEAGNTLLNDTKYLISYLEMRKLQVEVLKNIKSNIEAVPVILRQSYPIAEFLELIADSFHELNNVKRLLMELERLKEYYRKEQLPKSREEFEYRAILYQILKELEYFLLLKRNFVMELEKKDMKYYWN